MLCQITAVISASWARLLLALVLLGSLIAPAGMEVQLYGQLKVSAK